jgi:hypothetical protein
MHFVLHFFFAEKNATCFERRQMRPVVSDSQGSNTSEMHDTSFKDRRKKWSNIG